MAIERKSWFFMARDYTRAGFEERAYDAAQVDLDGHSEIKAVAASPTRAAASASIVTYCSIVG